MLIHPVFTDAESLSDIRTSISRLPWWTKNTCFSRILGCQIGPSVSPSLVYLGTSGLLSSPLRDSYWGTNDCTLGSLPIASFMH